MLQNLYRLPFRESIDGEMGHDLVNVCRTGVGRVSVAKSFTCSSNGSFLPRRGRHSGCTGGPPARPQRHEEMWQQEEEA